MLRVGADVEGRRVFKSASECLDGEIGKLRKPEGSPSAVGDYNQGLPDYRVLV
jgi:hypothetical protein